MLDRPLLAAAVDRALARGPAVALVGPRQVGKTTLARGLLPVDSPNWFDLEDPAAAAALAQPLAALGGLRGLVVIDEVQHAPELFKVLHVLTDRPDAPARFLLLGSASPTLLRQSAESPTGRIEVIEAGGFPRAFLADSDADNRAWRQGFIRNTVERDLPQLGLNAPAPAIHASGRCSRTTTARSGTPPNPRAPSASTRARCAATWTG